jgi:Lipocalin-like domain
MRLRTLLAAAFLATLLSSATRADQNLASQVVGVWKRTALEKKDLSSGAVTKPVGEKPSGVAIFTSGGHFSWTLVADGRKAPQSATPTDAERVALYNSAYFGSGTYRIEGDKVVLRFDTSHNQSLIGNERRVSLAVSGKVLTWTTPTLKSADGKEFIEVIMHERLE